MGLIQGFSVNLGNQTILRRPLDATTSLVFIDGYASGVFKGDSAGVISPETQPSQPDSPNPNDPTSFDDLVIGIPGLFMENVAPQDISASASLADIYNAGSANNARWAVQRCIPAVNANNEVVLTVRVGANDIDGFVFGISYHITAIGHVM